MKRIVIRALTAIAIVAAVVAVSVAGLIGWGEHKRHRVVEVEVAPVAYRTASAEVLEQGRYLYRSRGCLECHGADGGGRVFIDDPNGLHVKTPNITLGARSPTADYDERDWVRAIRHGLNRQSQPLLIMPSEDYNRLTDADLGALVAYIRTLPPKSDGAADVRLPLPLKAVYALGLMRDAAEKIDHRLPPSKPVPVGTTVKHGAYVAAMCQGCHGPSLAGGTIPGAPPEWPPASNLTPGEGGVMTRYRSLERFKSMMRTGRRADGSAVNPAMPFASLGAIDDTDLSALHLYLQTLPPKSTGEQ